MHLLAGLAVAATLVVAELEVLEDQAGGLEAEGVGPLGGEDRDHGFEGVHQGVDAGGGGEAAGHGEHQLGVGDGHVRGQRVVRDGVLLVGAAVGDDGEGGDFGAGAGGGGDGHHHGLGAQFGEGVDALLDVHEAHGHILELGVGVLVAEPHHLGRVHGGAAAEGDDEVGLEGVHALEAGLDGVGVRVRLDFVEDLDFDAHLVEDLGDLVGVTEVEEGLVGDEEGALAVVELLEGEGQAAVLEVDFRRDLEPEHVLAAGGDGLDVHEVLDSDVFRDGVAAPSVREGASLKL